MGNLFIGFPVPRAKIADMISTAAPPIIHADRHEASGDDEIAFQNILNRKHASAHEAEGDDEMTIPVGGIATLYDDLGFHYKTFFPNLDGFKTTLSGSGAITHSNDKIYLATGSSSNSWADVRKQTLYQLPVLTFDKNLFLRFRCAFNVWHTSAPNSFIMTAYDETQKHIGVSMYNDKLAYTCHDGSGRAQGEIISCPIDGGEYEFIVEIKHYAGSGVEYWIDGVKEHTQTYRQPSGAFENETFLTISVYNSNTTKDLHLGISMIEFYQPAA